MGCSEVAPPADQPAAIRVGLAVPPAPISGEPTAWRQLVDDALFFGDLDRPADLDSGPVQEAVNAVDAIRASGVLRVHGVMWIMSVQQEARAWTLRRARVESGHPAAKLEVGALPDERLECVIQAIAALASVASSAKPLVWRGDGIYGVSSPVFDQWVAVRGLPRDRDFVANAVRVHINSRDQASLRDVAARGAHQMLLDLWGEAQWSDAPDARWWSHACADEFDRWERSDPRTMALDDRSFSAWFDLALSLEQREPERAQLRRVAEWAIREGDTRLVATGRRALSRVQ